MYSNTKTSTLAHLLRGILIFLIFALTAFALSTSMLSVLNENNVRDTPGRIERALPYMHLYATVFFLFVFYSMARALIAADNRLCLGYVDDVPDRSRNTFRAVMRSDVFLLEWAVCFLLCLAFSARTGLFAPAYSLLARVLPAAPALHGPIVVLGFTLAFGLLLIVAHRSAMKEWDLHHEHLHKLMLENSAIVRLFKRKTGLFCAVKKVIILTYAYTFASYFLWFLLLLFFIPVGGMLVEEGIFWCIPTIIALFILIPVAHRRRLAMRDRRALVKRFEAVCREHAIEHTAIRHPVRSLFRPEEGADVTFTAGGVTYDVKIVPAINRHATAYFVPGHQMIVRHTVYFLRKGFELFHFDTTYSYQMEGDPKKLVVVCPGRATMFAAEGGQTRRIDTGDTLYGYTVFTTTGFINSIDRSCLPK